jgi:D-mannonate dehydratase
MGHVDEYDDRVAAFARQLGLTSVQLHNPTNLPEEHGYWTYESLRALRERCEADGLLVEGLENVPAAHFNKIQRGLPGRDEQLENYRRTVRNLARAGITLLGYNFLCTYVWRTSMDSPGRGGARVTTFDLAAAGNGNALAGHRLTPRPQRRPNRRGHAVGKPPVLPRRRAAGGRGSRGTAGTASRRPTGGRTAGQGGPHLCHT